MKKLIFSTLLALSTLGSLKAANLYSSNLGNGLSLPDAVTGIANGTVRFGVFPDGFDFDFFSGDYAALNDAFIQVHSFSGPLSVSSTDGFYQTGVSYDTAASYEGTSYATGIAGKKVYIWILDNVDPAQATQQVIVSSNQTWAAADAVVADTFASPDTGVAGLTFHVGSAAAGANIGAGANSHVLNGTEVIITTVTLTASANVVNQGTAVTLTAVSDGSPVKTYQWFKDGFLLAAAPNNKVFTIASPVAADTGVYTVKVKNGLMDEELLPSVESNAVSLTVNPPKPVFLVQPVATAIVPAGGDLELEAKAVAAGNLQYQWKKGASIQGATSPELFLPNMSIAQAGTYTVSVTNAPGAGTGTVVSNKTEVVVVDQSTQTVVSAPGGKVSFTVLTGGKGHTYQWYKEGQEAPLSNGTKYTGVTTKTLGVLSLQAADSGNYYCKVTLGEDSVNSGSKTLNVPAAGPAFNTELLALMPDAKLGATYSYQLPMTVAAISYAAKGLPAGLKLDAKTGIITGRPTKVSGDVQVTFTATGKTAAGANATATATVSIAVLASPELLDIAGSYVGPIDRNSETTIFGAELGGRFEMAVTTTGALTGKLFLGALTLPVKGFIELGGEVPYAELVVARAGGLSPLEVGFEIEDNHLVNGYISDTESDVNFDGYRNVYNTKTSPADDFAGLYNFGIGFGEDSENIGVASLPQGVGYGSFTVAKDGKLSVKGKTADGEAYTTSSFVGPEGQVFLFQTLYKTVVKGSIHGRMEITVDDTNIIDGTATWNRPVDTTGKQRTYAAGFDITDLSDGALDIVGGAYKPVGTVLLNKAANTTAKLAFDQGGIDAESVTPNPEVDVLLIAANKLTIQGANPAKTKLTVNAKTGLITGSFTLADKRAGKFEGLVITEDGSDLFGAGYFLLPEATPTITTSKILSGVMSLDVPEAPPLP